MIRGFRLEEEEEEKGGGKARQRQEQGVRERGGGGGNEKSMDSRCVRAWAIFDMVVRRVYV